MSTIKKVETPDEWVQYLDMMWEQMRKKDSLPKYKKEDFIELGSNNLILKKDKKQSIAFLNKTLEKGIDTKELNKAIINYLRQGLILKVSENGNNLGLELTEQEIKNIKTQTSNIKQEQIMRMLDIFVDAHSKIRYSPILQLPIELAILNSCDSL